MFYMNVSSLMLLSASPESNQRCDQRGREIAISPASLETPPLQTLVSAIIAINLPLRKRALAALFFVVLLLHLHG